MEGDTFNTLKFQGAGITTTDYDSTTNVLLITATEVDGSATNEDLELWEIGIKTFGLLLGYCSIAEGTYNAMGK